MGGKLEGVLRDLQINREQIQRQVRSELQAVVAELPAPIWAKCVGYLRMNATRRLKDTVSIEVPIGVKARLQDYQRREVLPSIAAALNQLLAVSERAVRRERRAQAPE